MIDSCEISMSDGSMDVKVRWLKFDGDDCFDEHLLIINGQRLDFGGCHVSGFRKWMKLVDGLVDNIESGFRNPEITTYRVSRIGQDVRIEIKKSGEDRIVDLKNPNIIADREFLREHWGMA
jgi:hypothetical protein